MQQTPCLAAAKNLALCGMLDGLAGQALDGDLGDQARAAREGRSELVKDDDAELRRLRAEVAELRMERGVLRRSQYRASLRLDWLSCLGAGS